ncbi:hypothetical protein [Rubrivirga sp.]|uniref:hypothetical protein n=1 Tax=Rubrivirga sp. TaxID=1885344 RepID=UPI003B530454
MPVPTSKPHAPRTDDRLWLYLLLCALAWCALAGCQAPYSGPTVQVRVENRTGADLAKLWLGVGGREHRTVLYEDVAAGATTGYQAIPAAYHGWGMVNATTTARERLPRVTILGPDQGGPVLTPEASYTLVLEMGRARYQQDP